MDVPTNDEEYEDYFTCVNWNNNNYKILKLPDEAFQLQGFESDQYKNKVFVRTKKSLLLVDTKDDEINCMFT